MTTRTLAGATVELNDEGFFEDPYQWTEAMGAELAQEAGVDPMTERHWQVVHFMRRQYLDTGTAPSIRALGKASGIPVKELYQLFPKGPAKLAAKIAGIPKPRGCI
jgi:tRNA 2-thiouridine synthesizing protein E